MAGRDPRDIILRDKRYFRDHPLRSGTARAHGVTTLTLARGSTTHGFEFAGDYAQSDFTITSGKTTTIGYA
jgi:hypothetical protein